MSTPAGRRAWRWLRLAFVVVATLIVVLSFLPLWQTDAWWVRQWDYPRLQLFAALLGAAVVIWTSNDRWNRGEIALGVGIIAALLWQASHFARYVLPWPKEVADTKSCQPGRTLKLLNANVLMTSEHYGDVLRLVTERRPDVILLLETGPKWMAAMKPLEAAYPYVVRAPWPNTYGMLMYSRLPMAAAVRYRLQPGIPSIDATVRLPAGDEVVIKALHPEPPWPGDDSGERDFELVQAGKEVRADGRATVVLGDLNDVAWSTSSRLFLDVGGMKDPRVGRGLYPTFHAGYWFARWPLDHLFVTPHWRIMGIDRLGDIGSDHFPIGYSVCLTGDADRRAVSTRMDSDTAAEANEQQREGKAESRAENRGE